MARTAFAPFLAAFVVAGVAGWFPAAADSDPLNCPGRSYRADPTPPRLDDWLGRARADAMRAAPAAGADVARNPPPFRWPWGPPPAAWTVEIEGPDGAVRAFGARRNFLLLDHPLRPGHHRWRVRRLAGAESGPWSAWRRFTVGPAAVPFVAPDFAALWRRVGAAARPRAWPESLAEVRRIRAALTGPDRAALARLVARVRARAAEPVAAEPPRATFQVTDFHERWRVARAIADQTRAATRGLREAVLAWWAVGDDDLLAEARRQAANLARWDPAGSTGVRSSDLSSLRIARALGLAADLAWPVLTGAERERFVAIAGDRAEALTRRFLAAPKRALERRPANSHGFRHATGLAALSLLLAGADPRAETWYRRALPLIVALGNPWGGADGGFANGVNYAVWDVLDAFGDWDVIRRAGGLDLAALAWPQRVARYFTYMLPPGAVGGVFGDGAEFWRPDLWPRFAAAFDQRVANPLSARWAAAWPEAPARDWPPILFGPRRPAPGPPPALADGAIFADIGWVAMLSDLDDADRVAVYFKASPYGSVSHSHADQLSFVVQARGWPVLIDSGYYDFYRSPHRMDWTIQTRAHNALTFDGGQGQVTERRGARGRILDHCQTARWDAVTSEAAAAYGGALKSVRRSLLYLRPDLLLVYDRVVAVRPRRFEWNLHGEAAFTVRPDGGLVAGDGDACVTVLAGPKGRISQTDRFPADPDPILYPDWQRQWHVRLIADQAATRAEYLVLIDIGCAGPAVADVTPVKDGGFRLTVAGARLVIGPARARLEADPAKAEPRG